MKETSETSRETFKLKYLLGTQVKYNRTLHKFCDIDTDLEVNIETLSNSVFDCEFNRKIGNIFFISGFLTDSNLKVPKIVRGS